MGWAAPEEKITRGIRVLVIASGVACAAISLLYMLASIMPLWYFHGYVRGYYSLLDYRLYYSHNWQQIPMPHTDYIRHVSLTFTLLSLALHLLSLTSILLARWREMAASGLHILLSSISAKPQPPPATLEPPPYTYTCAALTRTVRGAIVYTDFETYPLPGWATSGGIWSSVSGVVGAKGNVLQGRDNGDGIGDASYYYYKRLDLTLPYGLLSRLGELLERTGSA